MNEERVADRTATAAYRQAIAEAHSRGDLSDGEADSANRAMEIWADDSSDVYLRRLDVLRDHYTRVKSLREWAMCLRVGVSDEDLTEAGLAEMKERIEKHSRFRISQYLERDVRVIRTLRLADMRSAGDDVSRVLEAYRHISHKVAGRRAPVTLAMHGQPARSGDRGGGHRQSRRSVRRVAAGRGESCSDPDPGDEPPGDSSQSFGRGEDSDTPQVTIPPGWTPFQVVWYIARLLLPEARLLWHLAALSERRADYLAFGSDREAA